MFEPTKRKNFGWADDRKNCQIGHQQSNVKCDRNSKEGHG